nr:zinc finger protein, putative [Ipomoea batatas]
MERSRRPCLERSRRPAWNGAGGLPGTEPDACLERSRRPCLEHEAGGPTWNTEPDWPCLERSRRPCLEQSRRPCLEQRRSPAWNGAGALPRTTEPEPCLEQSRSPT